MPADIIDWRRETARRDVQPICRALWYIANRDHSADNSINHTPKISRLTLYIYSIYIRSILMLRSLLVMDPKLLDSITIVGSVTLRYYMPKETCRLYQCHFGKGYHSSKHSSCQMKLSPYNAEVCISPAVRSQQHHWPICDVEPLT